MKKTVIAIVAIVLLVAVLVGASHRWGYTRYGAVYYHTPQYMYYPAYHVPYYEYRYPYYSYTSPLSSEFLYRYGPPSTAYPTLPELPRGSEGQLCGAVGGKTYGCEFGFVCDYTKSGVAGVGVCSRQTPTTTHPYQVSQPATNYPYYG